ncbi:MAG: murein biosynthesis integral membrane protein MurJ [Caldilineaceae bacterium]|nr:murein biosynthesis integral membrane protein MurJ [Caldilineaceae bacterium]
MSKSRDVQDRPRHLLRASMLVIGIYGLNKVTGFMRLILMTQAFGAGPQADAYAAANQLPELFQAMLVGGALAAALIPVYTAYLARGMRRPARHLSDSVLTLVVVALGLCCALAIWQAPWIVSHLLAPDFSPEQQALTASLMRILLLATFLLGIASVQSSLLNAHQHFLAPALGTVVIDIGQILGLLILAPTLGIQGMAWGTVIGMLLYLCVQIPALARFRIAYRPRIFWRLRGLQELLRLMWPRIITLGSVQAVDLVLIRLASGLDEGSISSYFYALLVVVLMPRSLFGAAISTVALPTLSEQYNLHDAKGMKRTLEQALRAMWALSIPAVVGLVALGPPAIAFLFQRGSFDSQATALVYVMVVLLAPRLVAEATQDILSLHFYARHDTRGPMWASLGWMALNIALSFWLVGPLGLGGLALATTLAALALAGALYLLIRLGSRSAGSGRLDEARLARTLGRICLACIAMIATVLYVRTLGLTTTLYLGLAIGLGGAVYMGVYFMLGGREFETAWRLLHEKKL